MLSAKVVHFIPLVHTDPCDDSPHAELKEELIGATHDFSRKIRRRIWVVVQCLQAPFLQNNCNAALTAAGLGVRLL